MNLAISTLGRCGSKYFRKNLEENDISLLFNWNHHYPRMINRVSRNKFGVMPRDMKVIFLFADPIEIVLSVKQREIDMGYQWIRQHFLNLNANVGDYRYIYERDALMLERMFDEFYRSHKFELLTLRYETMHKYEDEIGDFIGKKFSFKVKYSERATKLSSANNVDKGMLINAYYDFKNKINKAEDIKVWRKRS